MTQQEKEAADTSPWIRLSKADISACPMRKYKGPIQLIESREELAQAVAQLKKEAVLGFDTETRPTFRSGERYPPAVLQLAGEEIVYIYQLKDGRLSKGLRSVFANANIVKAGVALDRDLIELKELAHFKPAGFVDLGEMAKKAGLQNHGLRGMAAALLGFRISKSCQTSNWAQETLTKAQLEYAATDAWVGRELYLRLQSLTNNN